MHYACCFACRKTTLTLVPPEFCLSQNSGGQERIRTSEAQVQQIYSLPPLATWVPARYQPLNSSGSIDYRPAHFTSIYTPLTILLVAKLRSLECHFNFPFRKIKMEPARGIEPPTRCLQNSCSTD